MAYTKHYFKTGDVLTAAQLNSMDDQIAKNEADAASNKEQLQTMQADVDNLKNNGTSGGSGGGGSYTLPIANNTTLGGVKPVTKTSAMTQSVGVDGSGRLYTAPTTGGGSGGLTEAEVESIIEAYGYGTYSKPSGGIPKTDLASAVQQSLAKADTALQSVPTATSSVLGGVKPVAKTSAMTQSVGVDSSGKLYTAPSSGGSGGGATLSGDVYFAEDLDITTSLSDCSAKLLAQSGEYKTIIFSKGEYTFNTAITIYGLKLVGLNGSKLKLNKPITILQDTHIWHFPEIEVTGSTGFIFGNSSNPCVWSSIKHCYIFSPESAVDSIVSIQLYNTWSCSIENCQLKEGKNALLVQGMACNAFNISDTVIESNKGYAVTVNCPEVGGLYFNNCVIETNGQYVLLRTPNGNNASGNAPNNNTVYFRDCYFESRDGVPNIDCNSPVTELEVTGGSIYPGFIKVDGVKRIVLPEDKTIVYSTVDVPYIRPMAGYSFMVNPIFENGLYADMTKANVLESGNDYHLADLPMVKTLARNNQNVRYSSSSASYFFLDTVIDDCYVVCDVEVTVPSGLQLKDLEFGFEAVRYNPNTDNIEFPQWMSTSIGYLSNADKIAKNRIQFAFKMPTTGYDGTKLNATGVRPHFRRDSSNNATFNIKGLCFLLPQSKINSMLMKNG